MQESLRRRYLDIRQQRAGGADLDIHKPKPIHGWRELLGEIGIIVVGVLIALAAEQAVEWLHWRHKVAEAEDALRLELRDDDLPQAYVRAAIGNCLAARLDRIEAAVDAGQDRQEIAALSGAFVPPIRTWDMEAWRAMLAGDVAGHMSAERAVRWSNPYRMIPRLSENNGAELEQLAVLRAGGRRRGPPSELERERVLVAVQHLRIANRSMANASRVMLAGAHGAGVDMAPSGKAPILTRLRAIYGDCVVTPPPEASIRLGDPTAGLASPPPGATRP